MELIKQEFINKYKDKIIHFSTGGMSRDEIFANLCYVAGVFDETIFDEINSHINLFNELVASYESLSYGWWVAQGRKFLLEEDGEGKFNFPVWYAVMKNRFGWADLKKISSEMNIDIRVEEVIAQKVREGLLN